MVEEAEKEGMNTEHTARWFQKIKEGKKLGKDQFVICILVGALLLVITIPVSENTEKMKTKSGILDSKADTIEVNNSTESELNDVKQEKIEDAEEYERYIENKLEQAIAVMEGAGKVKVMVTVSTSRELVVAKDASSVNNDTSEQDSAGGSRTVKDEEKGEETIYRKESDGSSSPYVVKTRQPLIEGVVVVAQGGDRADVKRDITEAVMALFNIEPNKIKVVKMKSE